MKRTGRCPKCNCEELGTFPARVVVPATIDELQEEQRREHEIETLELAIERATKAGFKVEITALTEKLTPLKQQHRSLDRANTQIRYACTDCGYFETYLLAPREFAELENSGWKPIGGPGRSPYR